MIRPMILRHTLALTLLAAGTAVATAQQPAQQATPQEQAACRPDAVRLCASNVGNRPAMAACLIQNKDKLSEACRQVIESRGR